MTTQTKEGAPEARADSGRSPGPVPWVIAGITVLMLGASLVLDQWATTRVGLGSTELAVHFGRAEAVTAAQTLQMGRAQRLTGVPYARMIEDGDTDFGTVDQLRSTQRYGTLLFVLILAAIGVRLGAAGLVVRSRRMIGATALVYGLATALVGAVFGVAILFNTSGAIGAYAERLESTSGILSGTHGYGISTWGVLFALAVDAFGVLMVKAALRAPRPRRTVRRRRRVKS